MPWITKANLRGPAGYNATSAVENIQTLADYVRELAGSNTFATELTKKFSRVSFMPMNARAYGISNTGTVDETVKINQFLADCFAAQREAYFPRGVYLYSQLVYPAGLKLRGAGIGGYGINGDASATMFRQTVGANKHSVVFSGNVVGGVLQIGPVDISDIMFRGEPGNTSGSAIAFQAADGTLGTIQDTTLIKRCLFRYWPQSGILSPAGARPFHVEDCNFLWNGEYGIDFIQSNPNYVQAVHFQDISGDGNGLGLIRLKGLDKHASVTFTSKKSERRVNPVTSVAGQLDSLIFEDCDQTVITVNGLTHISSVPSGSVNETPGAAMVIRSATGKRPILTWRGVTTRVRSNDVPSSVGPAVLRDEITGYIVPITVANGSYSTTTDHQDLAVSSSSKWLRGLPGQPSPAVAGPVDGLSGNAPFRSWYNPSAPANERLYSMGVSGSNFSLRTHSDTGATGVLVFEVIRSGLGTAILELLFNKRLRAPEFESSQAAGGVILRSPNGSRFRQTIGDDGLPAWTKL